MSISSRRIDQINSRNLDNRAISNTNLNSLSVHSTTDFIAYIVINEATMLDVRHRNSMLSFKLTAGEKFNFFFLKRV